jgi:hypothetical protein
MRVPALKWSGIAVTELVVAAVTFSSTWKFGEEGTESSHERILAYARARLGGAALASHAKGGDPDGGIGRCRRPTCSTRCPGS